MKKFLILLTALYFVGSASAQTDFALIDTYNTAIDEETGAVRLVPDTTDWRVLARPAFGAELTPAGTPGPGILAMVMNSIPPSVVEISGVYKTGGLIPFSRRAHPGGGRDTVLLWEVPSADQLTSVTVAVRSMTDELPIEVERVELIPRERLTLAENFAAASPDPLRLRSVANPVRDGKVDLILRLPEHFCGFLADLELTIDIRDQQGRAMSLQQPPLTIPEDDPGRGIVEIPVTVSAPEWEPGAFSLLAWVGGVGYDNGQIAKFLVEEPKLDYPYYEVEGQSIEGFSALERFGELVIYSITAEEPFRDLSISLPSTTDELWLAAGEWPRWAVDERMFSLPESFFYMAGGIHSLGTGRINNRLFAFYTNVAPTGWESLSAAMASGSPRFAPIAANPIWAPPGAFEENTGWRGNAFFNMNGGKLLVGLLLRDDAPPEGRAIMTDTLTKWIDLEEVPLPGLDESARTLTGFTDETRHYLLAGPKPQLFVSEHPLRGWELVPFGAPEDWAHQQLVQMKDRIWLFGIKQINGRGVVLWQPAPQQELFTPRAQEADIDNRPPGNFQMPPIPRRPTTRIETDVR